MPEGRLERTRLAYLPIWHEPLFMLSVLMFLMGIYAFGFDWTR